MTDKVRVCAKMDVVLVTGTAGGIGREIALKFIRERYFVVGIDRLPATISDASYAHHIANVENAAELPELSDMNVSVLINNAGVQNENDIDINLKGTINVTEKYGVHDGIRSIVNIASASAHTGAEFPEYSASKGGVLAYTKNVALRVAKYGATCNSISPGGRGSKLPFLVVCAGTGCSRGGENSGRP